MAAGILRPSRNPPFSYPLGGAASKKLFTLLDLCVSSLRRGHANLLCIVPILTDDPRRESKLPWFNAPARPAFWPVCSHLQTCWYTHARPACTPATSAQTTTEPDVCGTSFFSLGGLGLLSLSGIWQWSVGKQCMSCNLCGWLALTTLVVCKGPAT